MAQANRNGKAVPKGKVTLLALAEAKRLPLEFLIELGLTDLYRGGVGIPYFDAAGDKIAIKHRTALRATDGSYWPKGKPPAAYGLWKLSEARRVGFLILVEGESDCWALWHHGLPALGLPGANMARHTLDRDVAAGIDKVYIHRESDQGGATFVLEVLTQLGKLGYQGRSFELRCPDGIKDPADLHVEAPARFLKRFEKAILDSMLLSIPRPEPSRNGQQHHAEDSPQPTFEQAPLPIRVNLSPVPQLTPEMLPAPLRGWLTDIASRGCFPLEYPTAAALVAIGVLVGRKVGIRPKRHDDWLVVPNLWGAIVGPPGIQKTPPVEEAMRPLRRLVAEAIEAHEEALREFSLDAAVGKARADAAKEALKKAARQNSGKSEEDLREIARQAEAPPEQPPPVLRRYETNDPTVEKLGEVLVENPHGVLLFRDELMGFLRSLEKQGRESDRAFYLESWSGTNSFTYDRIGRGTVHVPAVCVSLFGTIQPGPLARYVRSAAGEDNDGLINRFQVLLYPDPPEKWVNHDRFPDTREKNIAFDVFRALDVLEPASIGAEADAEGDVPYLRFAPEAQKLFDQWREELETRLRSGDDPAVLQCHLSKYRSLMPSLALLFHLVDVAAGQDPSPVSLRSAEAAAAWCEVLEAHAQRVYQASFDGDLEPAVRLAKHLRDSLADPFTARDVQRKCWTGLDSADAVERALLALEERHWVRQMELPVGPEGGRRTRQYWVNPAIHANGKAAPDT